MTQMNLRLGRPARIPANANRPALIEADAETWPGARHAILARWQAKLGRPATREVVQILELESVDCGSYDRVTIAIDTRGDDGPERLDCFLLVPRGASGPRPAILLLHPTSKDIFEPVGLSGDRSYHNAVDLVNRGYVVLCPRNFLWYDRNGDYYNFRENPDPEGYLTELMQHVHAREPGCTGLGKMLADCRRSVDYLASRRDVDAARIGCFGFSLGAKQALFAAAFDERLQATVFIDGGIGLSYSNWDAPWYLGAQIHADEWQGDSHEILALVAPRRFLLAGSQDGIREEDGKRVPGEDGERSWPYAEAALPVFRALGAEDALLVACHDHGHSVPACLRQYACDWLDETLRPDQPA